MTILWLYYWLAVGGYAFVVGNFINWKEGTDMTLQLVVKTTFWCALLAPLAAFAATYFILGDVFSGLFRWLSKDFVLIKGRGVCRECGMGSGLHKMSCSKGK